ncbi:MAG: GntR family transcriptional regulator [Actinomycetota bacterium]|nr:GntR family transcriptional regulator [Actinomycetota bacterium]
MTANGGSDLALGERAYQDLLRRLITLEIRPGEPLSEDALASDLGLGVTPVRRAIQRLAQEGLVRIYPRRVTIAEQVRHSDIQHLWEIRTPLEETAAFYAATRASDAHRRELEALLDRLEAPPHDATAVLDLHRRVHEAVGEASMNPFIADGTTKLLNLTLRCWHVLHESGSLQDHDLRPHHVPLLRAILDRDPGAAVAASRLHVKHSTSPEHASGPRSARTGARQDRQRRSGERARNVSRTGSR